MSNGGIVRALHLLVFVGGGLFVLRLIVLSDVLAGGWVLIRLGCRDLKDRPRRGS